MAAPFAHEDLEKLKKFIEFVSANPLVLSMPELDFVKRFIEKFGGTVPAGNFQMPAGGDNKCPFGGDAKSETKPAPEPEAEEESEESELELDTAETIVVPLVEPNVLYLDVKPPKIARTSRAPRTRTRTTKSQAKKISKKNKVTPVGLTVKKELQTADGNDEDSLVANDPLYMPNVEVKIEIEVGETEVDLDHKSLVDCSNPNAGAFDKADFSSDEMEDEEQDEEYEVESKSEEEEEDCYEVTDSNESDEDADDGDELLIMLTKRKVKTPRTFKCHETCKQRCTQRFSEDERLRTCELFWSMSKEGRLQYIRSHTKQKRHARLMLLKFPTRSNHCCYFFDSLGCEPGDLIRVCRKFFETTLCISSYIVKKALNGYTPEPVCKVKPLTDQEKEERKKAVYEAVLAKKSKETQEILDPETGYLVTLASKAKKDRLNKKNPRRKPGDPQPKRNPKPIHCEIRCIYKCHLLFNATEREQICDHFWSLDYKRRKEFVLAHIETKGVLSQTMPEFRLSNRPPRTYQTRFYLDSEINTERRRVCKDFLMATLSITRHFITNALDYVDKNTGTYIGSDGRGKSSAKNRGNPPYWEGVMEHISSYPTWVPYDESKLRYLHSNLTIKLMHKDYEDMCQAQQMKAASINGYYKVFHKEFHLSFLCIPKRRRGIGLILLNPNISQYTGNEPGGYWIDPSGKKLDLSRQVNLDLTKSFLNYPRLAEQTATSLLNLTTTAASTKSESKLNNTLSNPP